MMTASRDGDEGGIRFGDFVLDVQRRVLRRDGAVVRLGARSLSILILLVEQHGRLVTKDEIMEAVWPHTTVEENNIFEQVKKLRKVLPPDAITTIPGRGYQFTAMIEAPAGAAREPARPPSIPVETGTNLPLRPGLIGRAAELAELPD